MKNYKEIITTLNRKMDMPIADVGALPYNQFFTTDIYEKEPGIGVIESFRRWQLSEDELQAELDEAIEQEQREKRRDRNGSRFTGFGFETHEWEQKRKMKMIE